ncbi:MAG: GNAT family N-acetyltransferase [Opitutaceae bacterium]|nr:GNAT family N-acetyltransferase [Opitutaceae bacterium]
MEIRIDDLRGVEIARFLEEHLCDMRAVSPPESKHALDLDGLRQPCITFWTLWDSGELLACGALKELDAETGEVKSMRSRSNLRRTGLGSRMLVHLLAEAKRRRYKQLYLETGAMPFFEPARRLYLKHGFSYCGPFGSYRLDPNSVHMVLDL